MSEEPSAIEQVNNEVNLQRALAVFQHRVANGSTLSEACAACNVPESTYYDWVNAGIFENYLVERRKARSEEARAMALESMPSVTLYQVRIATGGVSAGKGVNPTAAAKFVAAVAGVSLSAAERPLLPPGIKAAVILMPEMALFRTTPGEGIEIIDAEEVEELEPE